jgi:Na+/proline symporter
MGAKVDFEVILPAVVLNDLPVGCKGLILAALLAAFMSTFVSTVNSGAAYVVNDIYKRYLNPQAGPRRLVLLGYAVSVAVIVAGIVFGYATKNVHSVTKWVVAALVPAFVAPNVLKWHWWRFNGYGFFAGMLAGTAAAVFLPMLPALARQLQPQAAAGTFLAGALASLGRGIHDVPLFLLILTFSFAASVGVCLLTRPEPDEVLKRFYRTVRPWGWWTPIYEKCRAENPAFERNRDFSRDVFNLGVGLVWQVSMVTLPIYLVIQHWGKMALSLAVLVATSAILKFTWYDRLGADDMYCPKDR